MTVREIINSLEAEKRQLKEENQYLKEENKRLNSEIRVLKESIFETSKNEDKVEDNFCFDGCIGEDIVDVPSEEPSPDPEQPEKPIQYSDGAVPPIHTLTVGNGEGVEITGIKGTQEDLLKPDGEVVEETPAKPKRSRKKKVEPVEEPENA